jgi:hypothetical protein
LLHSCYNIATASPRFFQIKKGRQEEEEEEQQQQQEEAATENL